MGNLRDSMTEEEWNELGIPKDSLLRSINTDGEEDILSKIIDHPPHYGGTDNPYEAIKVIEAWELDFCLGNVLKYIARAGKKGEWKHKEDLQKAQWYLNRAINNIHE
jgi:hypothetical protein